MSTATYVLSITASLMVLLVTINQLRRHRMRERHAIWWLFAGTLALIASVFPKSLERVSDALGVELPVNLVFFVSIACLFFASLQHSAELTVLETKTRLLAERLALLEEQTQRSHKED